MTSQQTPGQCVGTLVNVNTIEAFTSLDRKALVDKAVEQLKSDVASGAAEARPELLTRFVLITFADLKQYKFFYWFCFPTVSSDKLFGVLRPLSEVYSSSQLAQIHEQFQNRSLAVLRVKDDDRIVLENASLDKEGVALVVADAGTLAESPGWNVRNLLHLIRVKWGGAISKPVRVLLMRDAAGGSDAALSRCKVVDVTFVGAEEAVSAGWEKDAKGASKPRMVNLAAQMDPKKLLTTAVDLNLKLMKWRLAPEMKLAEIASLKCLLLGSGTLGCNVARSLLGWGCRNITFVDSGKVSFSNPVRQTLFTFEDCLDGGKPKAEAAAAAVLKIFPECNAKGVQLRIPMPGHPIPPADLERTRADHDTLLKLAKEHDVIFLLTYSREARWLGTVMGAALGKIVINAALGFDTYLVMRHGNRTRGDCQLGCYFCSDVVAPSDSLRERTLDQQCTVTRPGVSMLASSLAIELLVSMLHSPLLDSAPADTPSNKVLPNESNPVGLIPHQIRGFVGNYSNMLIVGHAYDRCTACSKPVLDAYLADPFDFVAKVCSGGTFLEDLTGLTAMKNEQVEWSIEPSTTDDDEDGGEKKGVDDFSMD